jgi:hypothetical protein
VTGWLDRRGLVLGGVGLAAAGAAAYWGGKPKPVVATATPDALPTAIWDPPLPPGLEQPALPQDEPPPRLVEPAAPAEPAWLRYAQAYQPGTGGPVITIVIDDIGIDRNRSRRAMALPAEVTVSVMTYATGSAELAATARSRGHEVLAHVPMQPTGSADPGPHALTLAAGEAENVRRLRWGLDRVPGAVGVNNHMGSRFTEESAAMLPILNELRQRGLLFLDSRTSGRSVAAREAERLAIPTLRRTVFLDHNPAIDQVRRQVAALVQAATRTGSAIAIGHPYDSTLTVLEDWLPRATAEGVSVVPITSLLRRMALPA